MIFSRRCPRDVERALLALTPLCRSQGAADYLKNMIAYVEFGKDRRKLTLDFVADTRERMERYNADEDRLLSELEQR